jgi:hypothetical protein
MPGQVRMTGQLQHRLVLTVGAGSREEILRSLCPCRGITPRRGVPIGNLQGLTRHTAYWACKVGCARQDGRMIIAGEMHQLPNFKQRKKGLRFTVFGLPQGSLPAVFLSFA